MNWIEDSPDQPETLEEILKFLSPIFRSNLKFAAICSSFEFLKNYVKNLPIYIHVMNRAQNDKNDTSKQRETLVASLRKISLEHVPIAIGHVDYYNQLLIKSAGNSMTMLINQKQNSML